MGKLSIDEVIEHCKRKVEKMESFSSREKCENWSLNSQYGKEYWEHRQVAEWLKELKAIRTWKADIMENFCKYDVNSFEELVCNARNKAIDDLMNALCDHCIQQKNECYNLECPFCDDGCDIVNIAEQLKSQTKL